MKYIIGLTGKTGAGKSVIAEKLRSAGAYVIDGDKVSREVLVTVKSLLGDLKDAFGDGIIAADGTLDRKALARTAFANERNTAKLNSIFHPAVNVVIDESVTEALKTYDVAVVDAAAIIESGYADKCSMLAVVTAPEDVRLLRITERDSISREDALIRINAQKPDDFYFSKADFIIRNYEPFNIDDEIKPLLRLISKT